MKGKLRLLGLFVGIGLGLTTLLAQQMDPTEIQKEAERYYREGSYARAYELYQKLDPSKLPADQIRWLKFKLADSLWRSEASTQSPDTTNIDKARQQLEQLVRDVVREDERDQLWAEVQESLGDSYWEAQFARNWGQALPYYDKALDWWAGSDQIELARDRYLKIVWTMAAPPRVEPYYYYGYYGNTISLPVLENVLKIATKDSDRAHAHYLIAMTLRYQSGDMSARVPREFEEALKAGKTTDWHDDALFNYAQWLSQSGRMVRNQDGTWRREPDFKRALELYRQLITQYSKGETRYYDQAKNEIENITKPVLSLTISNLFLPGSEIQYYLTWRNLKKIDLALYPVDLTRDLNLQNTSDGNWIHQIQLREPVKNWSKDIADAGNHIPGQESLRLEDSLKPGSYVLVARAGDLQARDILLVTESSLVVKAAGRKALVYFCDVKTGAPIETARIKLWQKYYSNSQYFWRSHEAVTDKDGLAKIDLLEDQTSNELLATAMKVDRTAFSGGYNSYYNPAQGWKIYAFTDRPAYRPGDDVQWKIIARVLESNGYRNPTETKLQMEVTDPRGTKIHEQAITLNAFGSAWGNIPVNESMPLGEYQVIFYDSEKRSIGSASLFRLEEYKLPEFQVTIKTPEENGKKKSFRLGETVDVNIQAEYYFGGPVANANVEVVIYQNPFHHWWYPHREYSWFYEDFQQQRMWYGQGQIMKRETLKTDASGKAVLKIETPYGQQQDQEYRIEARVTDASRREIIASDSVRVTRQRYFVHQNPEHYLYRPADTVKINIKTIDANSQPIQAEGNVKITRDYWYEIWIDPDGNEISGKELDEIRKRLAIFPPPPSVPEKPWRLKFRGYQHDDILTRVVKTSAEGEGEISFKAEREGYYRVAWSSEDSAPDLLPVQIVSETTVWVATNATTELGYRHGGLELIVDKDTVRTGQKAPVMIHVPASGSYVLFSVEGGDLFSYQLIHMTGTVKLIELPIEEKHVPNIFLNAVMVNDRQIFMDTKQVVVPPVKNFLQVQVKSDREQYQPGEEGTLSVTTKDADGNPVAAELALSLSDESVSYIQQDYAGDPRQFFFGEKRSQTVQTFSTFQQKSYVDLKRRDFDDRERQELGNKLEFDAVGGAMAQSESKVGADQAAPPPPAVAGARRNARVAEKALAKEALAAPEEAAVEVRTDFRATAFWKPDVVTDKTGIATVRVKYPDSLTAWKATARVASNSNQFGIGDATTKTRKPLIVRLQAPRFFVVGDRVTISGVINNNTEKAFSVSTTLEASGLAIGEAGLKTTSVTVEPNSEKRVDWNVEVREAGLAKLRVTSRGGEFADAMEKTYPVFEHGIEKLLVKSGKVRGQEVTIQLNIPAARKKDSTSLSLQVTPSMAVTMLDALPYLIDYPYGCTEQTMSRFLPAVLVAKTINDLNLKKTANQNYGGIVEEHLAKTHPEGKKDLKKLSDMVNAGLQRLYDFQHQDGGWGWWKEGESDHFMTGYVVWGFTLARAAGVEVREDALNRGAEFLAKELVEQEDSYDMQSWMLHALSSYKAQIKSGPGDYEQKALANLWKNKDRLNAYTRALLALSAHQYGDREKASVLIRNLENGVKRDQAPDTSILIKGQETSESVMGTAHWGEDGIYWRWSDGGVEATAFVLRALLAIDPQNTLIEPVSNWLIKNRRGAQWSNTRDTAFVLYTLTDYLKVSQELKTDLEFDVLVNGSHIATQRVTPASVLSAPSLFRIKQELLRDGNNEIQIRKKSGNGPLYFSTEAKFFSLEEPVTAAGNEIFVKREYFRLSGKPTLLKGYTYDRVPLTDSGEVKSGERVEVVVTIEAKNNYEYLVFEDLKPAGLEAVEIRSGESLFATELKSGAVERKLGNKKEQSKISAPQEQSEDHTGRTRWVYQELRDRKVALFIDKLPQGVWQIRYSLRAEVPGQFHALPLLGHAMYVPEIRANGEELRIRVSDVN